ncbi:MAG: hypothetical protein WCK46_01145 [Candidatus Adlerbacteria bacterium]
MLFPALGQAQVQQASAIGWSYETTMLPVSSPGLNAAQVQSRCLALFGKKARYEGRYEGEKHNLTLTFETAGAMLPGGASYVTDRPICAVSYGWWNARQEGQWDRPYYFDGKTVFVINTSGKEPRTDIIMTPTVDSDGNSGSLVLSRRYRKAQKFEYLTGTFLRTK